MSRNQHTSPIPSDSGGREDIMAADPRDRDTVPGHQRPSPIPSDSGGREDIMAAESPPDQTTNGG
jgi:hypothetical protein